jgi:hypothetical protein
METSEAEIQIAARVSKATYDKIVERQQKVKKSTGITPSISAVVRAMIEEAATANGRKR